MFDKNVAPLGFVVANLAPDVFNECGMPSADIKFLMSVIIARPAKIGLVEIPMRAMPRCHRIRNGGSYSDFNFFDSFQHEHPELAVKNIAIVHKLERRSRLVILAAGFDPERVQVSGKSVVADML